MGSGRSSVNDLENKSVELFRCFLKDYWFLPVPLFGVTVKAVNDFADHIDAFDTFFDFGC